MKLTARRVVWLLPLFLTGCPHLYHKASPVAVQAAAPPVVETPEPKPVPPPADMPTLPAALPPTEPAVSAQPEPPKPPVKHRKPSAAKNMAQAPPVVENPGVSAIGQLSTGGPSDAQRETPDSLAAIERGLNGIARKLSDQEQKTAAQIREYLKQAKAALTSNDVHGASILAAKARVLLGELEK